MKLKKAAFRRALAWFHRPAVGMLPRDLSGSRYVERARRHAVILIGLTFTGLAAGISFKTSLRILRDAKLGLAEALVHQWHVNNQGRTPSTTPFVQTDGRIGDIHITERRLSLTCTPTGHVDCNCIVGWTFGIVRGSQRVWEKQVPCARLKYFLDQENRGLGTWQPNWRLTDACRRAGKVEFRGDVIQDYSEVEEGVLGPSRSLDWLKAFGLSASTEPNWGLRILASLISLFLVSLSHLTRMAARSSDGGIEEPWIFADAQWRWSQVLELCVCLLGAAVLFSSPVLAAWLTNLAGHAAEQNRTARLLYSGVQLIIGGFGVLVTVRNLARLRRLRLR